MADHKDAYRNWPEGYDGRFGSEFDAEVQTKQVVQVTVGTALIAVVAIVLCVGLMKIFGLQEEARRLGVKAAAVGPASGERLLPPGPLLQAKPEEELELMHHDEVAHLGARVGDTLPHHGDGWGWVDETAGVVHVPVEVAMDMVLASGELSNPAAATAAEDAAATDVEAASEGAATAEGDSEPVDSAAQSSDEEAQG